MRLRLFGWLALLVAPCASAAGMATIWESELALGGIHVNDTRASVIARLGQPLRQDDPRQVKNGSMVYADLQVSISESSTVSFLSSGSPKFCTPHHVCPGMPFAAAKAVYTKIHVKSLPDGSVGAWFGSRFGCRLEFHVEHDVIQTIFAGCPYWDAEQ